MIPVRLELEDFLSYRSPPPLDFTSFDVACLSGPNGAGKSALLDAITWACWGQARGCEGGQNQDRLIREGAGQTSVDYTFVLAGATYRIVRRRTRERRTELQFLVADGSPLANGDDWTNIAGETLRETEAKIDSVLRMDYRTFVASAFFLQGRAEDLLSRMRPDERKEIFSSLLGLGIYERLEEAARAKAREAEIERAAMAQRAEQLVAEATSVEGLERDLSLLSVDLEEAGQAEVQLSQSLKAKQAAVAELEKAGVAVAAERAALRSAERELSATGSALETATKELAAIQKVVNTRPEPGKADESAGALNKTRSRLEDLVAAEAGAAETARSLAVEIADLGRKGELLAGGGGECPLCSGSLDAAHRKRVKGSMEEARRAAEKGRKQALAAGKSAQKAGAEARKAIARLEQQVAELDRLEGEIAQAEKSREAAAARVDELRSRAEQAAEELEARRKALEGLEASLEGLVPAQTELEGLRRSLEKARHRRDEVLAQSARLEERLETARRAASELERVRALELATAQARRRYRRLAEAFGRGGIPDLVIDNARPQLEQDANQVLSELSGGEMSVHFNLQRETRSGKVRDTFDVQVFGDGSLRDFAMFSGGEAFRIAFAVRLAMSKLLVGRSGARLETLVIDEGFGSQDPEGRERLVEAIALARDEFAKVLVITHLEDLRERFDAQIRVWKGAEGSTFELEGEFARRG